MVNDDTPDLNNPVYSVQNAELVTLMTEVLARKSPFCFEAKGFSMHPFIRDGDQITLEPPPSKFQVGQVVAFVGSSRDRLLVHRIIAVDHQGMLTRGDNSLQADGLVTHNRVLGRVVQVRRGSRQVRLGLGLERMVIAWLSRLGWLVPLRGKLSRLLHPLIK